MKSRSDFMENVRQYTLVSSSAAGGYIASEANGLGVKEVAERILSHWSSKSPFSFVGLLCAWLNAMRDASQATELLTVMLAMYNSGSNLSKPQKAVRRFFRFDIGIDSRNAQNFVVHAIVGETVAQWLRLLKGNLNSPETFHAVVRWFKALSSKNRNALSTLLAITDGRLDPRAEALTEQLVGEATWKFLTVITDPQNWTERSLAPELVLPSGFDPSQATFGQLEQQLVEMDDLLESHNAKLAEATDKAVHASGCELKDAGETWDSMMQLVAGDVVSVVSPLRHSWMVLERKSWEFLSAEFPKVEVAAHPALESKGAACKFRLYTSSNPNKPIIGSMDTEGKMELADIAVLTPLTRLALQAVVMQSLAAVMVPRRVEQLAKWSGRGPSLIWEGEVFACRPVLHAFSQLGAEKNNQGPPIESVHRIHPMIAFELFRWLLDEGDWEDLLYQMSFEEAASGREYFCSPCLNAKGLLKARKVALSQVFHNTVRAHTRPVPGYQDGDSVVLGQVSDQAMRNYARFLRTGGRELDFRPVSKTYVFPDGRRVVRDAVPRTFNQGTFNSLDQVWDVVPDLSLKARAKKQFKF